MGHYILHFPLCHGMWAEMTGHKYHHRWLGVGGLRYGPRNGSPEEGGGGVSERGFNDPPHAQTFFLPPLAPLPLLLQCAGGRGRALLPVRWKLSFTVPCQEGHGVRETSQTGHTWRISQRNVER